MPINLESYYIDEVKPDFEAVLRYQFQRTLSSDYEMNTLPILKQWYKAKEKIITRHFNGDLIKDLGKHSFELDPIARQAKLNELIKTIKHLFNEMDLARFIKTFREEFFTSQKTTFNYEVVIEDSNGHLKEVNIPAGTKIIKAFKYFVDNPASLDALQIKASMLIQENKVSGHLYMSVHPLDYLSLSENTNNWRSCHALDGDYCAGNLSYMCDESTIVCYLCGEDKKKLPHFGNVEWNSKKWRMLLFTCDNEEILFAGRHYPFFSKVAMEKIKYEWTMLPNTPVNYSDWHDDRIETFEYKESDIYAKQIGTDIENPHIFINRYLVAPEQIIKDQSNLHYNDLLESSVYNPYYAFSKCWSPCSERNFLFIGNTPVCPYCGKNLLFQSGKLCCDQCDNEFFNYLENKFIGWCSGCGNAVYQNELFVKDHEHQLYCHNCAEAMLTTCESCENSFPNDMIITTEEGVHLCPDCALIRSIKFQAPENINNIVEKEN